MKERKMQVIGKIERQIGGREERQAADKNSLDSCGGQDEMRRK